MGAPIERERQFESANTRTRFFSCGGRWPIRGLFRKRPRLEADPPPAVLPTIVGVKKCAVYRDGDGQFRVIEFFLPADLLTKLRRPIEIQFLEGEELVTAQQFDEAISSGFLNRASASPDNLRRARATSEVTRTSQVDAADELFFTWPTESCFALFDYPRWKAAGSARR